MIDEKERKLQRECDEFVRREVIYCVSPLFYELGNLPGFIEVERSEEFTALTFPIEEHCGCDMDEEEKAEALENDEPLEPCGECFREIFEQWIVSKYLGEDLREKGEVVEEFMGLLVWGRTTTGQAIALDGVIRDIVKERR